LKSNQLTQLVTLRARLIRRVARTYLGSDEIRWRVLVTTSRFTSHIAIVCVALLAMLLAGAGAQLGHTSNRSAANPGANTANSAGAQSRGAGSSHVFSPADLQSYASIINQDGGLLARRAMAQTSSPVESRTGIITYSVQSGDTIETIAARFGLLPTTLMWSNQEVEDAPDRLSIGQVLSVLPVDGIWYTVEAEDTVDGIAEQYKAKAEDIINSPLNNLAGGNNLLPGTKIVVPGGVKPFVAPAVSVSGDDSSGGAYSGPAVDASASGQFQWPAYGMLSQGFWWGHRALDIASAVGVPIAAADGGYVSYAGWDATGYGYMLLIDHGNGFQTLYAHLSQYYVDPGQAVARGQVIAAMGSTGNSTGPHLHFEIRYGGVPQNPLFYLP
jgi:murein DD-endopeptidase MepM/ murein hydrolase activator NlpD